MENPQTDEKRPAHAAGFLRGIPIECTDIQTGLYGCSHHFQQSFYLTGGAHAMGSNGSIQVLKINLPANTVEWYYTVTTKSGRSQFSNNDLTGQLVKLVDPDCGLAHSVSLAFQAVTASVMFT